MSTKRTWRLQRRDVVSTSADRANSALVTSSRLGRLVTSMSRQWVYKHGTDAAQSEGSGTGISGTIKMKWRILRSGHKLQSGWYLNEHFEHRSKTLISSYMLAFAGGVRSRSRARRSTPDRSGQRHYSVVLPWSAQESSEDDWSGQLVQRRVSFFDSRVRSSLISNASRAHDLQKM